MSTGLGLEMKLALVVPGGVDRSGEYRVIPALLALIRRLSRDHEVHVFALRQEPLPAHWDLAGAQIHNIGEGWTRTRALWCIRAASRTHRFALVHSIWSAACGAVAVAAAHLLGVPSLVHVAGGEPVALRDIGFGGRLTALGRLQERVALHGASAVTAASAPLIRILSELGVDARRVPLGVDLALWPPCPPQARENGAPARLLHVASLNRVKDQPTLLRALAVLAAAGVPFHLDVVGDDTLHGSIQALTRTLALEEHVSFHGFLTQAQLVPLARQSHLLIVSSRYEAGPLSMLEAATQGVPTVGTAVGHVAEWSPQAALAVPVGDSAALAAVIRKVLEDEALRLRLAHEAFERARREDADYTARCFSRLYEELLATR
jgi:glycosyltransferase involved in cell wall biosynthesis